MILKDQKVRRAGQRAVMDRVRNDVAKLFPDSGLFAQDLSLTGFSASRGYPIEFTLEGPDWGKLVELSTGMMDRLKASGLVEDINTDYQDGMPEIQVRPDRDQAASRGVSVNAMGAEVSNLIGGYLFTADTQYPKDGHRYYIRVRLGRTRSPTG